MRRKLRQGKPRCNGSSGPMEGPLQCVEKASQSFAARRRRKKIKSFFRRRVRRKNTLRGASVESSATWGPRRSPAKRVRWGEEAQRSERRLPLCGGRRDTELVPTTRRAQRNLFGGKGVSLFRQSPAGTRCLWGRVPACGRDRSENRNYSALSTASTNRQVRSTESIPSRSRVEWISTMSGPKLTASRPGILSISRPHSSPA